MRQMNKNLIASNLYSLIEAESKEANEIREIYLLITPEKKILLMNTAHLLMQSNINEETKLSANDVIRNITNKP